LLIYVDFFHQNYLLCVGWDVKPYSLGVQLHLRHKRTIGQRDNRTDTGNRIGFILALKHYIWYQ